MKTKVCNNCNSEKKLSEFHKNSQSKDGHTSFCKICRNKLIQEYKKNHPYKLSQEQKKNRSTYSKQWRKKNKQKIIKKAKEYYQNNKDHIKETTKNYIKKRESVDPLYKFKRNIRKHMLNCFKRKGLYKGRITKEILGCELIFFKQYIEAQFEEGMTWGNFGVHGWHLDHIMPLASANTEEDIIKLCHYTNYQPMWAKQNIQKGNSFPNGHQIRLL